MSRNNVIKRIVDKNLCLGCGLCESIYGKPNLKMELQDTGFYTPTVKNFEKRKEEVVSRVCPGINVVNDVPFSEDERIWGRILGAYSAYSADIQIRTRGASGGVISAIATYVLDRGIVDAVLQVRGDSSNFKNNELKASRTREDVLESASSRYAPALVFNNLIEILENSSERYCFIGKPCDVSAIKNFLKEYPLYRSRIIYFISLFCAGMPSYNATEEIVESFKSVVSPVEDLTYRGDGWPGNFSFKDAVGVKHQMTYNDSWGKVLGKNIHFRCKICPDGIGLQADISVGDGWETKDGYPDFAEQEGQSLVLARTSNGMELLKAMSKSNNVIMSEEDTGHIKSMQPYQFTRRQIVGARIAATSLGKGILLNFRSLWIWKNLFKVPLLTIVKEFGGTMKRVIRKN